MQTIEWKGQVISKSGVYAGVPIEVYHGQDICDGPSFSSSNLRRVLEVNGGSPAHMYAEWSGNPNAIEETEKSHYIIGRAAHHLLLGEPNFAHHFAIRPAEFDSWRTAAARDWKARANGAGLTVLTPSDVETIKGMSRSLAAAVLFETTTGEVTHVKDLLGGMIERSFFWKDKRTGFWLKARPDAVPNHSGDFADLKTCASVQYIALIRAIEDYAYHQQAALVAEGARACAEIDMTSFVFVFVEKSSPYCVRPTIVKDEYISRGLKANRVALDLIARCMSDGRWLGPGGGRVEYIDLSSRYVEQADREIEALNIASEIADRAGPRRRAVRN